MICAWKELLGILPVWMRPEVDRLGKKDLQELRLRRGLPPELILAGKIEKLGRPVTEGELDYCINTASRYSPWAATSVSSGYITAPGGHRIGLCGEAAIHADRILGIRKPSSLCIRIARDIPGIAAPLSVLTGSALIIGSPGSGKTTLLRDLIRQISNKRTGCVGVVDEREELFPLLSDQCFDPGPSTDVLTGCAKSHGIEMLLRCMGPEVIAVDEITSDADCDALVKAGWCGVRLLATAHAARVSDLRCRPVYRKLWESGLFSHVIVLSRDKTWVLERMDT